MDSFTRTLSYIPQEGSFYPCTISDRHLEIPVIPAAIPVMIPDVDRVCKIDGYSKILHGPKYLVPWALCRTFRINSTHRSQYSLHALGKCPRITVMSV